MDKITEIRIEEILDEENNQKYGMVNAKVCEIES